MKTFSLSHVRLRELINNNKSYYYKFKLAVIASKIITQTVIAIENLNSRE